MITNTKMTNQATTDRPDPLEEYSIWQDYDYTENALQKRREWMTMMGLSSDEIEESCTGGTPANLDEEMAEYNAMCDILKMAEQHKRNR